MCSFLLKGLMSYNDECTASYVRCMRVIAIFDKLSCCAQWETDLQISKSVDRYLICIRNSQGHSGTRGGSRAQKRGETIFARNVAFAVARQSQTFKLVAICRDGVQLPSNGIRTCSRHKISNNKKMGGKRGTANRAFVCQLTGESPSSPLVAQWKYFLARGTRETYSHVRRACTKYARIRVDEAHVKW